MRTPLKAIFEL